MPVTWGTAMTGALYGPAGFFTSGAGPAAHFRTSVHASTALAGALLELLDRVDTALGRPDHLDLVDVGAGRGELLTAMLTAAGPALAARLRPTAVELAPRPPGLPAAVRWQDQPPAGITGLLLATEWLDNVPLDIADHGPAGPHQVLVDPATGQETAGPPVTGADAAWLARWWPGAGRAEIGRTRDVAWAEAVATVRRGLAVSVDYGHLRGERPAGGTLTGYRHGRQVPPVPDGSCDVTAHVAVDAVAEAGAAVADRPPTLLTQAEALRALGVRGTRPPLALASADPAGYVRALAAASAAAELTDPAGLGGHWWLLQPVGVDLPPLVAR
ncbi:SAM-dependent methyltransferase [Melissospora conviva]|uniref:SAM-dependent methyltransferase n=1 Tax=Melissospora conviva TaxID=3388432 RepID=UPI003B7ACA85